MVVSWLAPKPLFNIVASVAMIGLRIEGRREVGSDVHYSSRLVRVDDVGRLTMIDGWLGSICGTDDDRYEAKDEFERGRGWCLNIADRGQAVLHRTQVHAFYDASPKTELDKWHEDGVQFAGDGGSLEAYDSTFGDASHDSIKGGSASIHLERCIVRNRRHHGLDVHAGGFDDDAKLTVIDSYLSSGQWRSESRAPGWSFKCLDRRNIHLTGNQFGGPQSVAILRPIGRTVFVNNTVAGEMRIDGSVE